MGRGLSKSIVKDTNDISCAKSENLPQVQIVGVIVAVSPLPNCLILPRPVEKIVLDALRVVPDDPEFVPAERQSKWVGRRDTVWTGDSGSAEVAHPSSVSKFRNSKIL
jgi:hypothetical protein